MVGGRLDTVVDVCERAARVGVPAAGGAACLCSRWSDDATGQVGTVSGGLPMGMD
jgi:hypothetical protein